MKTFAFVLGTLVFSSAALADTAPITATLKRSFPLAGEAGGSSPVDRSANPNARYSNITSFAGSALTNGGAAVQGANTITRLLADDISMTSALPNVTQIAFSVANFKQSAVSARARIRFYQNDGPGGLPGTLIAGYSFNPISFNPGVALFAFNPTPGSLALPKDFWAGMTFDDNSGGTGATAADLDLLGQGQFGPVDVGSSSPLAFLTAGAGSFLANNPAGGVIGATAPITNFGWEFVGPAPVVPLPAAAGTGLAGLVILAGIRRRRSL